ncbi:MAG TPA: PilZ domain-containing protein [Terriglobales bacterium]|nr:PilZ domain-containing protein [Terriglobales bacterium]
MLMDRDLAPAPALSTTNRKTSARAALIELKESDRALISDCFRQFGIEPVVLGSDPADRLRRDKFEACVLKLAPAARAVMESARTSPSNSRMIIYGLGGSAREALSFSPYGINAVFREPLERSAAMKLVRATQTLVLHELRRYVRIPVIAEISVSASENRRFTATSIELSSGGMSMRSPAGMAVGEAVEISFSLLTLPRVQVRGHVSWRNPAGKAFGIRFESQDERRQQIKEWVDAFSQSGDFTSGHSSSFSAESAGDSHRQS